MAEEMAQPVARTVEAAEEMATDITKTATETVPDFIGGIQNFEITEVINRGIAYAIIIAGFLSVVFIIYGGIAFILSGGQDDKVKQAVGTIRHAIFGLIITILAVVIVATVGKAMGLDIIQYINFSEIIDMIQGLGEKASDAADTIE